MSKNRGIELSVIVPLFNEAKRAPPFLDKLLLYNNKKWEFIFVDDGSQDDTLKLVTSYNFFNKVIISYNKNKGKGYAVKKGVEKARGDSVIFIDADGSIDPSQIKYMLKYLKTYDVVVGTRASQKSKVKQYLLRKVIGIGFNLYVDLLYRMHIKDNLCGFKGFRKATAKNLFKNLLSERWVFDVEIFYKMKEYGIFPYQMPIKWVHKSESKMTLLDPFKIAWQILLLKIYLNKLKLKDNKTDVKLSEQIGYYKKKHHYMGVVDTPFVNLILKEFIERGCINNKQKILEIGTGYGRFSLPLLKLGYNITLSDMSVDMINQLKKNVQLRRLNVEIIQLDITKQNLQQKYDVIYGFHTLHHLSDLHTTFNNMNILLKKNGKIIFVEPNPINPLYYIQLLLLKDMSWKGEKGILNMGDRYLKKILMQSNFNYVNISRFGFFPNFIVNTKIGSFLERLSNKTKRNPIALYKIITANKIGNLSLDSHKFLKN